MLVVTKILKTDDVVIIRLNYCNIPKNCILFRILVFFFNEIFFYVQRLLGEYVVWLKSNNACEVKVYEETFEKKWASFMVSGNRFMSETHKLAEKENESSIKVVEDFSAAAASKLFEQEIREVVSFYFATWVGGRINLYS